MNADESIRSSERYPQDRRGDVTGFPDVAVRAVAVTGDRIWAGGENGLYTGIARGFAIDFAPVASVAEPVHAVLSTPDGIWIAAGSSLRLLDSGDPSLAPRLAFDAPEKVAALGFDGSRVWVATPNVLMKVEEDGFDLREAPGDDPIRRIAFDAGGSPWIATASGVWHLFRGRWVEIPFRVRAGGEESSHDAVDGGDIALVIRDIALDARGHAWVATGKGIRIVGRGGMEERLTPADGLPMSDARAVRLDGDTRWFALARGLARFRGGEWRYFAGRRWLPDDTVFDLAPDGRGGVLAATEKGIGWIAVESMTLEEKARRFQVRLRERHVRHGYVASSSLPRPGEIAGSIHEASDNDGLWTAIYAAAECFRYRVTGAPDAVLNAVESMNALERLERVTPIPGFPARALIVDGERVVQSDAETGEWHQFSVPSDLFHGPAPADWSGEAASPSAGSAGDAGVVTGLWKGDTSSDELVGHFYACSVFWDTFRTEEVGEWRQRVSAYAGRLADHLIEHDFNLIDLDSQHTRWGFFSPGILNEPEGAAQRGLNSLQILSFLKTAAHLTGEERFHREYLRLIRDYRYALNAVRQKVVTPGHVNHSDDELAFLSYPPLLRYETDPDLLALYRWSLRRSWEIERPERSPFFNFLYGDAMGTHDCDTGVSLRALEEIPLDIVHWRMENSHREDLDVDDEAGRFEEPQSNRALSPAERGMLKWNANPYRLDDGGGGMSEEDGAFFLMPYWLGRSRGDL